MDAAGQRGDARASTSGSATSTATSPITMAAPLPLEPGREARATRRGSTTRSQILVSMPTWVVMAVYLVQELHLSPLQLVLMGTAMEAAVFLFEIPTGVVADTYSRRLSLIVGYVGMGVDLDARRRRLGALADHRASGVSGGSRTRSRAAPKRPGSPTRSAPTRRPVFLRGARVAYIGSVLGLVLQVAIGILSLRAGVIVGGAITVACRAPLPPVHARDGLPEAPACRTRLRAGRDAHDRRERRALRLGGAGDPAPRRRRSSSWACPRRRSTG